MVRIPSAAALLAAVFLLFAADNAAAQRVLLLHSDPAGASDVAAKIAGTGFVSQIDLLQAGGPSPSATPSLATLLAYQAVMVWSNYPFADPTALGNVLADYVDQGGGVVQATFSYRGGFFGPDFSLGGRWHVPSAGYLAFSESPSVVQGVPRVLVPLLPAHPLLDDVASFHGGTLSFHSAVFPLAGTTRVANWSGTNLPLAGARNGPIAGRIAGLNLYPVSAPTVGGGWQASTDGARLMANALLFVMRPLPFSHAPVATPAGACVCTPLLLNADAAGAQHWWVRALGGPLTITAVAQAANSVDPATVRARVYDTAGTLVADFTAGYAAGQAPGFEASAFQTIAANPGDVYRVTVTTPDTPSAQSHFRLAFDGADTAGTAGPSSPTFEPSTWSFNTAAGETLDVRVSVDGTPASSTVLNYTLIDPDGVPSTGSVTAASGSAAAIGGVSSSAGTWALRVESATGYYRLATASVADGGVYTSWQSAGTGTLRVDAVTPASGGAPFTGSVSFTIRDAGGAIVDTGATTTGSIDFEVAPGEYVVDVAAPEGWSVSPASMAVIVSCDKVTAAEVVIVDDVPPTIEQITPSVTTLWPANHKMVPVAFDVAASDPGGGAPACEIVSVASNEPTNGAGDGNTAFDWTFAGLAADLRAERAGGGSGRVYTVTVACTDAAGNSATAAAIVGVPKSQGGKK